MFNLILGAVIGGSLVVLYLMRVSVEAEAEEYQFYKQWDSKHGTDVTPQDLKDKFEGDN